MRLAIISTNQGTWGGSEELWHGVALAWSRLGHRVGAFLSRPPSPHPKLDELSRSQIETCHLRSGMGGVGVRLAGRLTAKGGLQLEKRRILRLLQRFRPDFALISMGGITESFLLAGACSSLRIPYSLVVQQASEIDCPSDADIEEAADGLRKASRVFFVSEHNRRVVREQMGLPLDEATIVRNPVMVESASPLEWPSDMTNFALACPARMVLRDKGQDLLLRVLNLPKWRSRPLAVNFFGSGRHSGSMVRMAHYLGLRSVRFHGQISRIEEVWKDNHACVLPSRVEGLPLALVEAMWCGRPAIVTDAGGSAEVVRDNVTGFIARTPSVADLDEALERAWSRRDQWQTIGGLASVEIRRLVPADPAGSFAQVLLDQFAAEQPMI